jgi:hypothetical protein
MFQTGISPAQKEWEAIAGRDRLVIREIRVIRKAPSRSLAVLVN